MVPHSFWKGTLFQRPSSSNIIKHQLLFTKYGPGFGVYKWALSSQDVGKSPLHVTQLSAPITDWPLSVCCLSEEIRRGYSDFALAVVTALRRSDIFPGSARCLQPSVGFSWLGFIGVLAKTSRCESSLISDLEQSLLAAQETQPELGPLKGSWRAGSAKLLICAPRDDRWKKEIHYNRSDLSFNYGSCGCMWTVKREKNLRGVSSVSLSEADLCHRRAPSISFHFKHSLCLRSKGRQTQKVFRSECLGSSPLLPPQWGHHWPVTILGEEISSQKWDQYYIINAPCPHCLLLSWTGSHTGATVVPSTHTNLASTHVALAWLLHIPSPMPSLYRFKLDLRSLLHVYLCVLLWWKYTVQFRYLNTPNVTALFLIFYFQSVKICMMTK